MVQAEKHAETPLVSRGGKGSVDEYAVRFCGSVMRHEGKFKMWYIAMDENPTNLVAGEY